MHLRRPAPRRRRGLGMARQGIGTDGGIDVGTDWLRAPVLGRFLRWRHARTAMQVPLFALAVLMIAHGLFGPQLSARNSASLLTWVHFRGGVLIALLVAGNLFCMACPFMLPREIARRFLKPALHWPRWLRNKWLSLALFVLILLVQLIMKRLRTSAPITTLALILATVVGLAMKLGFITRDLY